MIKTKQRPHWFQFISNGILALFMGIMIFVTYVAYSRTSGSTGLNMAKIQQIRYDDVQSQFDKKE